MSARIVGFLAALMMVYAPSSNGAADDAPTKRDAPAQADQAKRVKPHSHLEEKGIPHADPDRSKKRSDKKDTRHQHQRDAK